MERDKYPSLFKYHRVVPRKQTYQEKPIVKVVGNKRVQLPPLSLDN